MLQLLKQNKIYMTKQQRNIREWWVTFKRIIHGYNYWKESKDLELTNYIYIYSYIYVCVCDNTNSDVKTFKMQKKIYN